MKKNMGSTDKTIRVVIAIALLIQIIMGRITGGIGIIVSIAAILFLVTSSIGICPLYTLLGKSTKEKDSDLSDTVKKSQSAPESEQSVAAQQESAGTQEESIASPDKPVSYGSPDKISDPGDDENREY